MTNSNQVAVQKGIFWFFSTTIVWQISSWILTLLTARILNAKDYGIFAISDAFFPYLLMLCTFKIDEWLLQSNENEEAAYSNAKTILLFSGFISTLIGIFGAPIISKYYNSPELALPLQVASLAFIPRSIRVVSETICRKKFAFKEIAIINLVLGIVRGIFQLLLAYLGFGYWSLVIGGVFFEVSLTIYFLLKEKINLKLTLQKTIVTQIVRFGFYATGSLALWVVFSTADNLIVGKILGLEILGYYAMAFYLSDLPFSKVNSLLSPVLVPYYAKIRNDKTELIAVFLKYNRLVLSFVSPIYIFTALNSEEICSIFLGNNWRDLSLPLKYLCVLGIIKSLSANVALVFNAIGKPKNNFYSSLLCVLILPCSFYLLGKTFGLMGIFYAWLIIYPVIGPFFQIRLLLKELDIRIKDFIPNIIEPFICVLCFALPVFLMKSAFVVDSKNIIYFTLQLLISVALYLSCYWMFFKTKFVELYYTIVPKKSF